MTWDSVRDQQVRLSSVASIATFLAAVQSQIIALSYQDNSTAAHLATNITGFAGILLDVITAFLALLASTTIQHYRSEVEKQLKIFENLSEVEVLSEVQQLEVQEHNAGIFPDLFSSILAKAQTRVLALSAHPKDDTPILHDASLRLLALMKRGEEQLDLISVKRSCTHIQSMASLVDAMGSTMLFGVLCFIASVLCLAIASQPRSVWVVSVVTCSVVIVFPMTNLAIGVFLKRIPSIFVF
ncbi:hypothetical protein BDP27DRAFT_1425180 [Rhodocollybia butyracea]|uniref:Transmembrane protein n=1 Tax=Rhodocollybia butyracea TaxID=206335 RepID=A0A9P5PGM6_9AGAR|nr:hypothetical protein BDP27DRAFT_1425180 [Rhodocollybia butyracea]